MASSYCAVHDWVFGKDEVALIEWMSARGSIPIDACWKSTAYE